MNLSTMCPTQFRIAKILYQTDTKISISVKRDEWDEVDPSPID